MSESRRPAPSLRRSLRHRLLEAITDPFWLDTLVRLDLLRHLGPLVLLRSAWAYWRVRRQWRRIFGRGRVKCGRLEAWAETGTEGFIWVLQEFGAIGFEGMQIVDKNDRLIVFLHDGSIVFDDVIDPDFQVGYRPYPLNPDYGQPCAFGCGIHWTQRGWTPENWATLFFHGELFVEGVPSLDPNGDRLSYRAILIKAKDCSVDIERELGEAF